MDIEPSNQLDKNEGTFSDFLTRQDVKDNFNFTFNLDQFRMQHPLITQDVIRHPTKYYKIIRNHLEKNLHGDERKKYESKIDHFNINFEGNLGSNFVTPRGLHSRMAN